MNTSEITAWIIAAVAVASFVYKVINDKQTKRPFITTRVIKAQKSFTVIMELNNPTDLTYVVKSIEFDCYSSFIHKLRGPCPLSGGLYSAVHGMKDQLLFLPIQASPGTVNSVKLTDIGNADPKTYRYNVLTFTDNVNRHPQTIRIRTH